MKGLNIQYFHSKRKIDRYFREIIMPIIRLQEKEYKLGKWSKDSILREIEYKNYLDSLHKDEDITDKQRDTYNIPKDLL